MTMGNIRFTWSRTQCSGYVRHFVFYVITTHIMHTACSRNRKHILGSGFVCFNVRHDADSELCLISGTGPRDQRLNVDPDQPPDECSGVFLR